MAGNKEVISASPPRYRQLAQANSAIYQPYVAQTLNNLADLHIKANNTTQAAKEVEEAIHINRERWKTNPEVAADDLAKSLVIAIHEEQDSIAKCQFAKEAVRVAHNPQLIALANKEAAVCTPP